MGAHSHIQWTDHTWNPIGGCSIASPGCRDCYAQQLSGTRLATHQLYAGTTTPAKTGPIFNGRLTVLPVDHPTWTWPLRMRGSKEARRGTGARNLIFVGDMSDLFHKDRPAHVINRIWAIMALARHLDFQVLTKRADVMRDYVNGLVNDRDRRAAVAAAAVHVWGGKDPDGVWETVIEDVRAPLANVWLGTSTEDQQRLDERWPALRDTPAALRFLSVEPQIGRIDMCEALGMWWNQATGAWVLRDGVVRPDWVIGGGESGPTARDYRYSWGDSLARQCAGAGIAYFQKQVGSAPVDDLGYPEIAHDAWLKDRKGGTMEQWPERLRVRQWPEARP